MLKTFNKTMSLPLVYDRIVMISNYHHSSTNIITTRGRKSLHLPSDLMKGRMWHLKE